jgi:HEAT repeat protein
MTTVRKRVLAILCVGFLAVIAGWVTAHKREPRYDGKSLSQWLREFDLRSSPDPLETLRKAYKALNAIGTNSFPYLEKMLCATDPPWKRVVIAFNAKQSLLRLPVTPAQVYRGRAMRGYSLLGPAAGADVPGLIQLMNNQKSPEVRCCIAGALGEIGPEARDAIPVLMNAVTNQNAEVSRSAVFALRNIRRYNEETIR